MSADRELLELAAKALGWRLVAFDGVTPVVTDGQRTFGWRPHTDGGDALRLAARLRMDIQFEKQAADHPWSVIADGACEETDETQDIVYAACRSIVRAAAEIGRAMP